MNKDFLPYDICERLKILGFNKQCFAYYNKNQQLITRTKLLRTNSEMDNVSAVLPYQALEFFREKFTVDGVVDYYPNISKWGWYVRSLELKTTRYVNFIRSHCSRNNINGRFDLYNDAQKDLILYMIDIAESTAEEVMLRVRRILQKTKHRK